MIYVVGDSIIDRYISGVSTRLSPEAPVPVMKDLSQYYIDGGAMNVFNNIREDKEFIVHPDYVAPLKTRVICNGKQMVRYDEEKTQSLQPTIPSKSFVVISDYNKGAIHDMKSIIFDAEYTIVDPKRDFSNFISCNIMKCNREEFEKYYGATLSEHTMNTCYDYLKCDALIVTDSSNGVFIYDSNGYTHQEIDLVTVIDVTGAGDVFLAVLASCIYKEMTVRTACKIAAKAATLSVTKMGTYVLTDEEYQNCFH